MEISSIVIGAVSALAAIVAAIVAIVTLRGAREEQLAGLERKKKKDTLDAYNKLQEQVLDKIGKYRPSEIREAAKDNQTALYAELGAYLARIEHFCVGITNDIYDYNTFYALAHGYFDKGGTLYNRLTPLIEKKLEAASEDYYANIHEVWRTMEEMTDAK